MLLADCSHQRAVDYFSESVASPIGFKSLKCESFENYEAGLCDGNQAESMGNPTRSMYNNPY